MSATIQPTKECVHHWLLSPPLGGKVEGECRHCGQQRAFNSDPSRYRAYGRPARQAKNAS